MCCMRLDQSFKDLGFSIAYTEGRAGVWNTFLLTVALMCGTAGLPHVIVRFFTVPTVRDARMRVGHCSLSRFCTPSVQQLVRLSLNLIKNTQNIEYAAWTQECSATQASALAAQDNPAVDAARVDCAGQWFKTWENSGLLAWMDKNGDGKIQIANGAAFKGKPAFDGDKRGPNGERLLTNEVVAAPAGQAIENEVYFDRDIIVLANPEIASLPNWVIALELVVWQALSTGIFCLSFLHRFLTTFWVA